MVKPQRESIYRHSILMLITTKDRCCYIRVTSSIFIVQVSISLLSFNQGIIVPIADSKPSPRRAVNVRSPMKYLNGILQQPDTSVPNTGQSKLASSFDVIEGSPTRRNVYNQTHTQMKPKSNR